MPKNFFELFFALLHFLCGLLCFYYALHTRKQCSWQRVCSTTIACVVLLIVLHCVHFFLPVYAYFMYILHFIAEYILHVEYRYSSVFIIEIANIYNALCAYALVHCVNKKYTLLPYKSLMLCCISSALCLTAVCIFIFYI